MLAQLKKSFSGTVAAKKPIQSKKIVTAKAPSKRRAVAQMKAEGEQCFWCNDGKILATHDELKEALLSMSAETYAHHTDGKNDFATWVEFVLCDVECAKSLRKATSAKTAAAVLAKHRAG